MDVAYIYSAMADALAESSPDMPDMSIRHPRLAGRARLRRRHAKWATMAPLALREFAVPVMLQSFVSPNVALRSCDRVERRAWPTPRGDA